MVILRDPAGMPVRRPRDKLKEHNEKQAARTDPDVCTGHFHVYSWTAAGYNSLGKYQILSIDKAGLSINKTCSKCDSFQLYQWSGRIRDNLLAAYGKSIIL